MGRVMAIDYGLKRVGIAVTDPLRIIASPLTTVNTPELLDFLETYMKTEPLDELVVGMPVGLDNRDTDATQLVRTAMGKISGKFPGLKLVTVDERFTSKIATASIREGGAKKKQRRDKKLIDKVSASLILQTYLGI